MGKKNRGAAGKSKEKKALRAAQLALEQKKLAKMRSAIFLEDGCTERDVLADCSAFAQYSKDGMDFELEFYTGSSITEELSQFTFDLVEANMKSYYTACEVGWNEREKRVSTCLCATYLDNINVHESRRN